MWEGMESIISVMFVDQSSDSMSQGPNCLQTTGTKHEFEVIISKHSFRL